MQAEPDSHPRRRKVAGSVAGSPVHTVQV